MGSPVRSPDQIARSVSEEGSVAVRAIVASALVSEGSTRHGLSPTATSAFGRALMGGLLMAAGAQEEETVQIQFRGDGPLGQMIVIATPEGEVRGTLSHPEAEIPSPDGRARVAAAIGKGVLSVVRHHPRWREPHTGIIPLANSEVATDLAEYMTKSEQTPTAVGLGVAVRPGGVEAAGGFWVQALPDADDAVLALVERNVRQHLESPADLVRAGATASDLLDVLLRDVGSREVHLNPPRYHCPCSRERVTRTVVLLGRTELLEIAAGDEELEIYCDFCRERYALAPQEVQELIPSLE